MVDYFVVSVFYCTFAPSFIARNNGKNGNGKFIKRGSREWNDNNRKKFDYRNRNPNLQTMIHNALFQDELSKIPSVVKAQFDLNYGIADKIDNILREQHLTQRDLARMTGKRESEVSKWLTGRHNFTLKTIALISTALGQPIITI